MNEQIIKRLRDAGDRLPLIGDTGTNLHLDAAKEIEKLQAEVEQLRTANLDSVAVCEQALQAKTAAEQERDQLKAILQDVNTSDYRFSVEQLSVHDAEVIKQFVRDYTDWQGIDWMLTDFMHKRVDELSQKAKEVQS